MCGSKEYHQPTETENADMVILHFRLKDPTADLPNLSDFQRVVANYIYDGRLDNLRRYSSTGDNPERAKIIMRNRFTILKTMISESTGRDHSAKQILLQALYDVVKPAKLFKFIEDDHKSSIHESIGGDPPPKGCVPVLPIQPSNQWHPNHHSNLLCCTQLHTSTRLCLELPQMSTRLCLELAQFSTIN